MLLSLLFALIPVTGAAKMVSIAKDEVHLRSGPSLKNEIKWVLGRGFPLQVVKSRGQWLQVRD
ncbi:MAG: peptide-binding protein, partial [Proteobacteria bacterium]|nr:peptide-binding protein [Pseudomonadota bacterium]